MAITIDSMIWIYSYDPYAPESKNVKSWLRGKDGALQTWFLDFKMKFSAFQPFIKQNLFKLESKFL